MRFIEITEEDGLETVEINKKAYKYSIQLEDVRLQLDAAQAENTRLTQEIAQYREREIERELEQTRARIRERELEQEIELEFLPPCNSMNSLYSSRLCFSNTPLITIVKSFNLSEPPCCCSSLNSNCKSAFFNRRMISLFLVSLK